MKQGKCAALRLFQTFRSIEQAGGAVFQEAGVVQKYMIHPISLDSFLCYFLE